MKNAIIAMFCLGAVTAWSQNFSWTQQNSGTTETLNDVQFLDANNGWVAGDNGVILRTVDGGNTWNMLSHPDTTMDILGIHFINTVEGWACGGNTEKYLIKTTDGGVTWTDITPGSNVQNSPIRDLVFSDGVHGWIMRSDSIYYTSDGGTSWTHEDYVMDVEGPLMNEMIQASNDSTAFVAGRSKRSGWPDAYGDVFSRQPTLNNLWAGSAGSNFDKDGSIMSLEIINDTLGFAGDEVGKVYRLEANAPITTGPWNEVLDLGTAPNGFIFSIGFANTQRGMFVTYTQIGTVTYQLFYHTQDGGDNWNMTPDTIPNMISPRLDMPNDQNAWVVATSGKIYHGIPSTIGLSESGNLSSLKIFPNPASTRLSVSWPDGGSAVDYYLINATGESVLSGQWLQPRSETLSLDIANLPRGVYFMRMTSTNGTQATRRVVISR